MLDGLRSKCRHAAAEAAMPGDRQTDFTVTGVMTAALLDIATATAIRHGIAMIDSRGIAAAERQYAEAYD